MTAIKKMVEYLNKNKDRMYGTLWEEVREEAIRLATDEAKEKPTAYIKLVEEIQHFANLYGGIPKRELEYILSRYKPTESIAGLPSGVAKTQSVEEIVAEVYNEERNYTECWYDGEYYK